MKKTYTSPCIERVQLKAEEAVLTSCKNISAAGSGAGMLQLFGPGHVPSGYGNCNTPNGAGTNCNTLGS